MAPSSDTATPAPRPTSRVTGATLRATEPTPDTPPTSRARDPWERFYRDGQALTPPYSYEAITALYDASDVLQASISAMATNVGSFGVQLVAVGGEIPEGHEEEAAAEKARLTRWFRYASAKDPIEVLLYKLRVDYELFGDMYLELLKNARGELVGMEHLRAYTMRKGPRDREHVEALRWVREVDGSWSRVPYQARFRRYAQLVDGVYTWFKEWGDPRPVSATDGRAATEERPVARADLATDVLNLALYAPDSVYGKPRWRGAAADVSGRNAAAEVNGDLFDHKGVPPVAVLVQGALLGQGSTERIREHFAAIKGREHFHEVLVIEAAPAESPTGDGPVAPVKIDIKNLSDAIEKDALFSTYRKEAAENIGATFRLPPLFFGRSTDYTRATADAAKAVANEQVFAPERAAFDEVINRELLPELGARYWEIKSRTPPMLSEETLADLIRVGLDSGALTPAQAAELLEAILGLELSRTEDWAKLPTLVVKAMLDKGWRPPEAGPEQGADKPPVDPSAPSGEAPA